jgi:hypothetical protein
MLYIGLGLGMIVGLVITVWMTGLGVERLRDPEMQRCPLCRRDVRDTLALSNLARHLDEKNVYVLAGLLPPTQGALLIKRLTELLKKEPEKSS